MLGALILTTPVVALILASVPSIRPAWLAVFPLITAGYCAVLAAGIHHDAVMGGGEDQTNLAVLTGVVLTTADVVAIGLGLALRRLVRKLFH